MNPLISMALGKVIDVVSKRAAARGRIKEAKEEEEYIYIERARKRVTAFVVVLSSREVFLSVRRKRESLREIFLSAISSITANKSRQIEDKDGDVRRGRRE